MAMTKTEKARMDELQRGIRAAKAMRWPEYGMPAPMTRAEIEAAMIEGGTKQGAMQMVARGWFHNAHDSGRVTYGCSNGTNHDRNGDRTSTQHMGLMFKTEADAWRAIRVEMTERFAEQLARIDEKIAEDLGA